MDSCCLSGPSGDLCVAAAGKWAVCVWSHTSASDWSLIHTWTFNDVSVFVCLRGAETLVVADDTQSFVDSFDEAVTKVSLIGLF